MNRREHLEWCKQRALEYVRRGDTNGALTSMISDLRKHEDTSDHIGIQIGMALLMTGRLNSADEVKKYIEDFN